ncbi:S8 family peptidase [Gemmatimonas aurantiaca]|nr:S8 family peptidase [Gemmatimonas aurantiaca]
MRKIYSIIVMLACSVIVIVGCSESPTENTSKLDQTGPTLVGSASGTGLVNVLIGYDHEIPTQAIAAAGGAINLQYRNFPVVFASVPAAAIDRLASSPNVLYVERDFAKDYVAQTLDWGVDRIDAEVATAGGADGAGIKVGVLDSGGDIDHEDITWAGGYSATNRDPSNWNDKNGHGTHVAGIISADDNDLGVVGVAPNCSIYAIQVGGNRLLISDIIEGIDWGITNGMQVFNMSFGGGDSQSEHDALIAASNAGILLVAAAGNSSGAVSFPAAYPEVMAISSSTSSDAMSGFSNFGSEIELIAPGSSIYSTYKGGGYKTLSGTSMASPMVVGAAAAAWSANTTLSRDQLRDLLKSSAEDIGLSSNKQGSGLVDVENAALGTTTGNNLGGGGGGGGSSADTMHVASITFGGKKHLETYVTIHDESHTDPVADARVEMTLTRQSDGKSWNFAGNTNSSGEVKFTLIKGNNGDCYDATITNVTKNGTTYNSSSNDETTDSNCP